jgi:hypothetical protein
MADEGLLEWQWRLYKDNHRDRTNLIIHLATWPLFLAGLATILVAPFTTPLLLLVGPAWMALAMALQGRGHKREQVPPVPFRGPADVARRIFAEQLITFPRYLISGELGRAWRGEVKA